MSIHRILAGAQKEIYYIPLHAKTVRRVEVAEVATLTNPIGGKKKHFVMLKSGFVCTFSNGGDVYVAPDGMIFFCNPLKKEEVLRSRYLEGWKSKLADKKREMERLEHEIKDLESLVSVEQRRTDLGYEGLREIQQEYLEQIKKESIPNKEEDETTAGN